jgi:hypothetical protein
MASYSGDPSGSRIDEVRFLLQDTGPTDLLSDDEITYLDTRLARVYNDPIMTAATCADVIAARCAHEVSISADGVSAGLNELQQKFADAAISLRSLYKALAGAGGVPLVGGIDATGFDPAVRPLNFGIGMDDNYRAGDQGNERIPYTGAEYESGP